MDPKLAEIYGTNQPDAADLEKLAAAELAEGLANDDQLDTDGLTEEELEAVAQEVLNAGGEEAPEGEGEGQEKTSADEAQEKLAEADYLGRVMAHSYVKELREIEKTSGIKDMAGKVGAGLKNLAAKAKGHAGSAVSKGKEMAGKGKEHVKRHSGKYGAGAGLAVGAGGGYAAGKHKKSSAMDTLVTQRAQEILEQSGIDPSTLKQVAEEGQEKVSDPREALSAAVDQRAWELLGQYGVVPAEKAEE